MDVRGQNPTAGIDSVVDEAMATVQRWLDVPDVQTPTAESRLARVLDDPAGAQFTRDFIDGVIRPESSAVAAKNFERMSWRLPESTTWLEGAGTHVAGGFAPLLPAAIMPTVRENFLKSVGHLVVRGESETIEKQVSTLAATGGIRPTVAPLTAVASGHRERRRHVADAHELLLRAGVDAITLSPASFLGQARLIDLDAEVESAVQLLAPLYTSAAHADHPKLIDLDVAMFDELEISLRIFEQMMAKHPKLNVGISLPASLPESLPALQRVIDQASTRRAAGGARVTVRLTRGTSRARDLALASTHGWHPAAFTSRSDTDAHYLRLLDYALTAERTASVQIVSANHHLFTVALAWRLGRLRGVERSLEHEFPLGVASAQRDAVKRDVGGVRLYIPVEQAGLLSLIAPYLKRQIGELSLERGHLPAFPPRIEKRWFAIERATFPATVKQSLWEPPVTHRVQNTMRTEVADFTVAATREWASALLERARDSASGEALLARSTIRTVPELNTLISEAITHGASWGERRGSTRATVLESVAETLAEWRGRLVETEVSESGITVQEADSDVTIAIECAHRAAHSAREVEGIRDARYHPPRLVVVVSSRSIPLTSMADHVLSALGAGSAVIIKAAPEARRSAAVFIETLTAGGVPWGLVTILDDEGELARALICDERVDHVLHTGSRHTAKLFHSWRAETQISSTTGGRNSVIVTQSADFETAVPDIVRSAFDHAGQSPSAVGTVILVGTAGQSARFLGRLTDAVNSVAVATPGTVGAGISALARPATARQRALLGTLEGEESWRVEPQQVDTHARLWSPGLRDMVAPNSRFRKADNHAPVIGIVRVKTLAEAIDVQNALGFGLSAGIHSLDADEIDVWRESAEAGLLSVNCCSATARGGRAPVHGWNRSAVGTVTIGGDDSVVTFGQWEPTPIRPAETVTLEGISEPVAGLIAAAQSGMDFEAFDFVRTGARSDEEAWADSYGPKTLVETEFERIEHRYLPVAVTVRLSDDAPLAHLVRVLVAATRAQSTIAISTAIPLHADLIALFGQLDTPVGVVEVVVESEARWRARVLAGGIVTSRVRLIGGDRQILARVLHGQIGIAVHAGQVTTSGRIELLPFLRGQTICTNTQPLA